MLYMEKIYTMLTSMVYICQEGGPRPQFGTRLHGLQQMLFYKRKGKMDGGKVSWDIHFLLYPFEHILPGIESYFFVGCYVYRLSHLLPL